MTRHEPSRSDAGPSAPGPLAHHARLGIILLLAFALRLAWMLYAGTQPFVDFEILRRLADSLVTHHQYGYPEPGSFWAPGYPAFLAAAMLVSRSVHWLAFVNVVMSTLICGMVFVLARRLFRRDDVAHVAALICAVYPTFVCYSPVLGTEHLFVPLVMGATLLALADQGRRWVQAILCGVLLGAAILARGEAIFYAPLLFALFLFRSAGAARVRERLAAAALLTAVTAAVVLPWYIRNERVIGPGAGLATSGGINFYFGHNPDFYGYTDLEKTRFHGMDLLEMQKEAYRLAFDYLKAHPASLLRSASLGTYYLFRPTTYPLRWSTGVDVHPAWKPPEWARELLLFRPLRYALYAGYLAFLLVVVCSIWTIRSWPLDALGTLAGLVGLNWLFYAVAFWAEPRYRYLPEVFFCIPAAVLLLELYARFAARRAG